MHAHTGSRDETITPRSRQKRNPSLQALKPLVSPLSNSLPLNHSKTTTSAGNGTGSKPIMDWFRKLGHGRRAAESATGRTEQEKPVKELFRHQASLGLSGTSTGKRKQQAMTPETRRRSVHSHHGSSIKSSSIRSSRPTPPFSPPRTTQSSRYPRAATFMTRSDASPASSFISSTHSRRSESEHSLAESYLDADDPDARSFVPSVMADEDASLRPFPPSIRRSSTPRSTSSIDGLRLGRQSLRSHVSTSPLPPFIHTRRNSQSTTTTTHSSFGAASRTWTNDAGSRGTPRSVDTRPTTIISSLDLPQRVAHIAQVPPPQAASLSTRPHPAGIHRTLTWDSGLSASPSVPSPLGTSILPHPRSILEHPRTSPPTSPGGRYPCNVPRHSHPHPRDNPRPLARPEENASLVTLASSEFAQVGVQSDGGGASIMASSERREASPSRDVLGPPLIVEDASSPYDPDEEQQYTDATPMIGSAYPGETTSSPRRTISYFDRASSTYYFTGAPTGGSILNSSLHAGHPTTSLRSHEDRGVDDRASVTAVRRRGSWESGESSFSGAGQQLGPGARGSFSLASLQHVHRSSSLNQIASDTSGMASGLAQSLGRLSVADPRDGRDMRLGEVTI